MLCQTTATKTFTTYEGAVITKGTPLLHSKEHEGLICIIVDEDFGWVEYAVVTNLEKAKKAYSFFRHQN